jgi:hypothetical protein
MGLAAKFGRAVQLTTLLFDNANAKFVFSLTLRQYNVAHHNQRLASWLAKKGL